MGAAAPVPGWQTSITLHGACSTVTFVGQFYGIFLSVLAIGYIQLLHLINTRFNSRGPGDEYPI